MIGRTLAHYKVVEQLGSGGMGVVYNALDLRLDRHVALKVLPPDSAADHDRRARFLHEARAASALNDPHIVTIFDIFTDDQTDVLVMELVAGRTLRDILNDGLMPIPQAIDIVLQVAEGVGAAHAAGIVHRDLKPGNVMVTDRGRVKVLDFGLAKLVTGGSIADQATIAAPTTVAGMLLGTVDYMSPEQAIGGPIDARTDVFSLGAMLYEMLTGTRPFVAAHAPGILHEIIYGTIVPPRARRPEIPTAIDAVVLRALERDLARRYASMESLAVDLRRAPLEDEASPPPVPRESPRESPRVAAAVTDRFAPPSGVSSPPAVVASPPPPMFPRPPRRGSARTAPPDRPKKRKRSGLRTLLVIVAVVLVIRGCGFITRTMNGLAPVAGALHTENADDVGTAVETAVAGALDHIGPNSAAIQLARAQIYWKRALKNGDAELTKQAEDTFNTVLRLNPNAEQEAQAREALQQIAASKAAAP